MSLYPKSCLLLMNQPVMIKQKTLSAFAFFNRLKITNTFYGKNRSINLLGLHKDIENY